MSMVQMYSLNMQSRVSPPPPVCSVYSLTNWTSYACSEIVLKASGSSKILLGFLTGLLIFFLGTKAARGEYGVRIISEYNEVCGIQKSVIRLPYNCDIGE